MMSEFMRNLISLNAYKKVLAYIRWPFYAGLMFVLVSCSSDPFHALGMKETKEGPVDEGVAKLKKSSKDHPENIPYRQDYLREREKAVNGLLKEASFSATLVPQLVHFPSFVKSFHGAYLPHLGHLQ